MDKNNRYAGKNPNRAKTERNASDNAEVQCTLNGVQMVYTLRHLETDEFVCLRHIGNEYLSCFTRADDAHSFRTDLQLVEFVDVVPIRLMDAPFRRYWLDGQIMEQVRSASSAYPSANANADKNGNSSGTDTIWRMKASVGNPVKN